MLMFKPLRIILSIVALLLVIFATKPGTEAILHGLAMIPTLILPVIAPIVFFVLLLDTLMLKVFLTDKEGREKKIYRISIYINLLLVGLLLARWYPYINGLK